MKKRSSTFEKLNTRIIALSVDSPHQSQKMLEEMELPFTLLCDEEKTVVQLYDLLNPYEDNGIAYPAVFIIDPQGMIRYRSLERTRKRVNFTDVLRYLEVFQQDPSYELESHEMHPVLPSAKVMQQISQNIVRRGSMVNWLHYLAYPVNVSKKKFKELSATQTIEISQTFSDDQESIFSLISDPQHMDWMGLPVKRIQDSSDPAHPNGTGAIRAITFGPITFEETITNYEFPRFYEYQVSKGSPVRNHSGRIEILPNGNGCRLYWTIRFDSKIPYGGMPIGSVLKTALTQRLKKLGTPS